MSNRHQQLRLIQSCLNRLKEAVSNCNDSAESMWLIKLQKSLNEYDTIHRTSLIDEKKLSPSHMITVGDITKLKGKSEELLTKERELNKQ